MLKKTLVLFLFCLGALFAKSHILSTIPATSTEILNIDIAKCDYACQIKLLEKGMVFSFLSKYNKHTDSAILKNAYQELQSLLNLETQIKKDTRMRVAILVPSKIIGRYASAVIESISAFLLSKNIDFELQVYDSKTEDLSILESQIEQIAKNGFKYVVAPLTSDGAQNLARLNLPFVVYVPTVNKSDVNIIGNNIVYGGINYQNQVQELEKLNEVPNLVIFEEPISLSKKITSFFVDETKSTNSIVVDLKTKKTNFKDMFENIKIDENTTVVLNTRPIMTSLILSQLTYNDIQTSKVLSTQLNFTSMILGLTQAKDLENLYVVSSISALDDASYEANRLFNNDISFDWVVYSSTIMADLILQRSKKDFSSKSKTFGIDLFDNSLMYRTSLYKIVEKRFVKLQESSY